MGIYRDEQRGDSMAEKKAHYSSETGTRRFYVVEARTTFMEPQVVNGVLLTNTWQRLRTTAAPHAPGVIGAGSIAVPSGAWPRIEPVHLGLLEREAAYALAVRFMVDDGTEHGGFSAGKAHLCVETRLVEVKLAYSYSIEEVGVCEPFSLFESLRHLKSSPREVAATPDAVDPVNRGSNS